MAELSASTRGEAAPSWQRGRRIGAFACAVAAALVLLSSGVAHAIEAITVEPNQEKIDITAKGELYEGRGDRLQIETAPGPDGYVGRMAVSASTPGTNPGWIVFALSNPTSERIVRWLVAPRYSLADSRVFWPILDAPRIAALTPSLGFRPETLKSARADIFRLNLEPGQTVTFAAELASQQVPRLNLWDPNAYQAKQQDRMLFNGVLLGITGLLAIFLTAIFAANHRAIFPATALIAWAALAYFCVDFGFWNKLFPVGPDRTALYRAAAEAGLAASLVLFLYAFLRIGLWHGWIRTVFWGLDRGPVHSDLRRHRRSRLCRRPCPRLAGRGRRHRHRPHCLFRPARTGPRAVADPELDAADRLAVRRRHGRARQAVRRPGGVGAGGGPGADPGAARLYRDAIRLPLRRRAAEFRTAEPGADEVAGRGRLRRARVPVARRPRPDHHSERSGAGAWA